MSESENAPLRVSESAVPDQIMAGLRSVLMAAGAALVSRGTMDQSTADAVVGVVMLVAPFIWSQVAVRRRHAKLVTAADAAPDEVAQVKGRSQ